LDARAAAGRHTGRDLRELDVLEIGAGQRFPLSLLVHSAGARVIGFDMDEVTPRAGARRLVAVWRGNGPERALKTLVRRALFDRAFYRDLARAFGAPLGTDGLDLRVMDACTLEFPDESFDCILSVSVFEHIHDVGAATREMARVLRPGGVAYVDICINRLRWDDYLAAFRRRPEVLELTCRRQGEAHFTEEVRRELPGYSRDDLLTGSMLVVLGKGPRPGAPPA
jgi:SAM-dependent methyltransferase